MTNLLIRGDKKQSIIYHNFFLQEIVGSKAFHKRGADDSDTFWNMIQQHKKIIQEN